mgnify:CR=1 FL=1
MDGLRPTLSSASTAASEAVRGSRRIQPRPRREFLRLGGGVSCALRYCVAQTPGWQLVLLLVVGVGGDGRDVLCELVVEGCAIVSRRQHGNQPRL